MTGIEPFLVAAALLVLLGVLASKLSARLGVPALLLFIGVGALAGSEGLGGIAFADYGLAQNVGIVALAYILYAGGTSTSWSSIRPVLRPGIGLATLGVAVTAGIAGTVAAWALDLPWTTGLLLGAIVSSTDAAAVFSVLRSQNVSLRGDLRPLLELESGSNDPMAVFLTIGLVELLTAPETSLLSIVSLFFEQMLIGAAVGLVLARLAVAAINRMRLDHEGLYPVVTLAAVLLIYGVAAWLGGSGFLAVYLAGIVIGNAELLHKNSLHRFHDALAWLCQIGMFVVLGLLVFPSQLPEIAGPAVLVAVALVFLARPVAVFATLAFSRYTLRERLLVSWVGLRGAVPIILATFPLVVGLDGGPIIFDVVFVVVIVSVLIQGTSIPAVAKLLAVDAPLPAKRPYPIEAVSSGVAGAALHELEVAEGASIVGRSLLDLGLPPGTLIVLISRDDEFIVPQGATLLHAGDKVLVLAHADVLPGIRRMLAKAPQSDAQPAT